jgi:hypothetical protein
MGASQSSEPVAEASADIDIEKPVPDENPFEDPCEYEKSNPLNMNWFWPFM